MRYKNTKYISSHFPKICSRIDLQFQSVLLHVSRKIMTISIRDDPIGKLIERNINVKLFQERKNRIDVPGPSKLCTIVLTTNLVTHSRLHSLRFRSNTLVNDPN